MKKEIAYMWADYIRLPERIQTIGCLGNAEDDGRCCLGHLCDIAVSKGVISQPAVFAATDSNDKCLMYGENEEVGILPAEVMKWAGIRGESGEFCAPDHYT